MADSRRAETPRGGRMHRLILHPGDALEVQFIERLVNGYPDPLGFLDVVWQERDAPTGEVATKGRELQLRVVRDSRVGPLKMEHP